MVDQLAVYLLSSIGIGSFWPMLWYVWGYSTKQTVSVLFVLDIAVTIEAAFYSNILLIAVLHVITIPAFFAVIYIDLLRAQSSEFQCFLCEKPIEQGEETTKIRRSFGRRKKNMTVHKKCIDIGVKDKKSFSESKFRNGIPR
ncbi:MAG: hypothetical protein JRN15_18230 [Nitrososphaerota archaeon]|nr:hypothetical protein [Nitrososphaerota archaeon]